MKTPFAKAQKFARENPNTARDTGVAEALALAAMLEMYRALKGCERFIRQHESDWSVLTDDQHGEYPGAKALAAAEAALNKAEGRPV